MCNFYPSGIKYLRNFIHCVNKIKSLGHLILGMIFMITSVPNESYSIHASCALNLISTFLFDRIKDLYK